LNQGFCLISWMVIRLRGSTTSMDVSKYFVSGLKKEGVV
jgi:hypothetical protein